VSAVSKRASGEGGLFKRGDGLWVASVAYHDKAGKRKFKRRTSKSYEKAVGLLRDLQNEVESGVLSASPTVAEWLNYWLEDIKRPEVRQSTHRMYERTIRLYIIPVIGNVKLAKLSAADIRKLHNFAPSSRAAQKAHQLLHQALRDAIAERLLTRNVASEQRRPKHKTKESFAFSPEVAKHVMRTALTVDERMASRWAAAFYTGARQGELLGLELDRLDLDGGTIDLSWQLQQMQQSHGCGGTCGRVRVGFCPQAHWELPEGFSYRIVHRSLVLTEPKTARGKRLIPLAPPLLEMLRVESQRPGPNPHGLVWHNEDGRPINPRDDYQGWKDLLAAAGILNGKTIPLHSARHTAASLLMECGVDPQVIQDTLGHSSAATTLNYKHTNLALAQAAMTQLGDLLS